MAGGWGWEMSEISLSFSFFDGQFSHCTFKVEFWATNFDCAGEVGGENISGWRHEFRDWRQGGNFGEKFLELNVSIVVHTKCN